MYTIRLTNCAFFARHGALPEEAALGQRFFVDAELTVDALDAVPADDVTQTVHYGEIFSLIAKTVETERFNLIEALGHRVASLILENFPLVRVAEVTVRKPSVPIPGLLDHVSATVVLP